MWIVKASWGEGYGRGGEKEADGQPQATSGGLDLYLIKTFFHFIPCKSSFMFTLE